MKEFYIQKINEFIGELRRKIDENKIRLSELPTIKNKLRSILSEINPRELPPLVKTLIQESKTILERDIVCSTLPRILDIFKIFSKEIIDLLNILSANCSRGYKELALVNLSDILSSKGLIINTKLYLLLGNTLSEAFETIINQSLRDWTRAKKILETILEKDMYNDPHRIPPSNLLDHLKFINLPNDFWEISLMFNAILNEISFESNELYRGLISVLFDNLRILDQIAILFILDLILNQTNVDEEEFLQLINDIITLPKVDLIDIVKLITVNLLLYRDRYYSYIIQNTLKILKLTFHQKLRFFTYLKQGDLLKLNEIIYFGLIKSLIDIDKNILLRFITTGILDNIYENEEFLDIVNIIIESDLAYNSIVMEKLLISFLKRLRDIHEITPILYLRIREKFKLFINMLRPLDLAKIEEKKLNFIINELDKIDKNLSEVFNEKYNLIKIRSY